MKNLITFLLLLGTLSIMSSCGLKKTPLAADRLDYAGKWVSNDGSWIHIYNNGGEDLKEGNTSVSGGKASFEEGNLEIGLFGIGKTYTIDIPSGICFTGLVTLCVTTIGSNCLVFSS